MLDLSVYYMYLQYFDTVGWVFWPVKTRLPYYSLPLLYCVGSWRGRKTLLNPILTCGIVFLVVNYSIYIQFCSVYTIAVGVFFIVSSCASCAPYNCSQMWVDKYAKTCRNLKGINPVQYFFLQVPPFWEVKPYAFAVAPKSYYLNDGVIMSSCSPPMLMSSPVILMIMCTAMPYRLQPHSYYINCMMLPQASHGVVLANVQVYHTISEIQCRLIPKLL